MKELSELERLKLQEGEAYADFAECCGLVLDSAEALRALANEIDHAGGQPLGEACRLNYWLYWICEQEWLNTSTAPGGLQSGGPPP